MTTTASAGAVFAVEPPGRVESFRSASGLAPRGHHPCDAPYGFEMYYLNVMAGPLRKWCSVPVPAVDWIMKRDA